MQQNLIQDNTETPNTKLRKDEKIDDSLLVLQRFYDRLTRDIIRTGPSMPITLGKDDGRTQEDRPQSYRRKGPLISEAKNQLDRKSPSRSLETGRVGAVSCPRHLEVGQKQSAI